MNMGLEIICKRIFFRNAKPLTDEKIIRNFEEIRELME